MNDFAKGLGAVLVVVALLCGIGWAAEGNNFFLYRFFAPKQEAVRRQVFEQSKAYNQGMIQELQNMQFEFYRTTDRNARAALAPIILHRAADYDEARLPVNLRTFVDSLTRNVR